MLGFHDLLSARDTWGIGYLDFVLEQPCAVDDIICRQALYLSVHLVVHGHFLQRRHFGLPTQLLRWRSRFARRRAMLPKFRFGLFDLPA